MEKEIKFEDALEKLEKITILLEKGNVSLDESLKLFEEGTKLSAICYEKLANAQQRVEEISVNKE